jgi:peptide/nickel transport system substrate-binding protein
LTDDPPANLDPRFANRDSSAKIAQLLFRGLVTVDNDTGRPELELAARIDTPEPTLYDIELRDDARWHDGQPVLAQDVKFTLESLARVKSPYAELGRRIAGIEVLGPRRLQIRLNQPHAPFLTDLALGIVPAHAMGEDGLFPKGVVVGSGPYKLGRWEGDAWVSLEPAASHAKPGKERLIFRVLRDDNTRLLELMGGGGQLVQNATPPALLPVLAEDDSLVVEATPSCKYTYLAFNLDHPILKHVKVRQALALGLNREEIVEGRFGGTARLSTGLLPPEHWAYEPEVPLWPHDPARAKALLDEAGYPDPDGDGPQVRFTLVWKTRTDKFRRSLSKQMAVQLGRIGVGVEVRAYEWGTLFDDIKKRNFEMASLQWPTVVEPDLYFLIFHSSTIPTPEKPNAGANRGGYKDPEMDRLLEEGRTTLDPAKRKETYGAVQRKLAWDLPYVSLWHEDNLVVRSRELRDYRPTLNARYRWLGEASLTRGDGPR